MAVGVREDEQLDDATRAFEDLRAEVVVLGPEPEQPRQSVGCRGLMV